MAPQGSAPVLVAAWLGLTLAEVVRRLAIAVLDHTADELHDDLTLLLFKYRQSPAT